jgi:hypothetical protein
MGGMGSEQSRAQLVRTDMRRVSGLQDCISIELESGERRLARVGEAVYTNPRSSLEQLNSTVWKVAARHGNPCSAMTGSGRSVDGDEGSPAGGVAMAVEEKVRHTKTPFVLPLRESRISFARMQGALGYVDIRV